MDKKKRLTIQKVKTYLESAYNLVEVTWQEDLTAHYGLLQRCIDNHTSDPLHDEINEWYAEAYREGEDNAMEALKECCLIDQYPIGQIEKVIEDNRDELLAIIRDRDFSNVTQDLLKHTGPIPVQVSLYSNYDCINSTWFESQSGFSYEDCYFGDMVDALHLNPFRVKRLLQKSGYKTCGRFPDRRSLKGKELVSYEDFAREIENSTCPGNLLVFMGKLDPIQLYERDFDIRRITIPAGNKCGIFSSCYGGGSLLEMTLLREITIDLEDEKYPNYGLLIEGSKEYSIRDVFGIRDDYYGKELDIAA